MKLPLYIMPLLVVALAPAARAVPTEVATGIFYFSADGEKNERAESEFSEDGLRFRSERDPRAVARDHALEEIRVGNVCLTQADSDLRLALKERRVRQLCDQLFGEELEAALSEAQARKLKPDYFRCVANAEAHETEKGVRVVLAFRGALVMREKLPAKLRRAFTEDQTAWALPVHEAPLGEVASGWKGALKAGACGVDADALKRFLENHLARKKEAKALDRCRGAELRQVEELTRLQRQFRSYVPDEWQKEAGGAEVAALLTPPTGVDAYAGLKECRETRGRTFEQLSKLRKLSARIASKHDVPALDPANSGRSVASEEDED